MCLLWIIMLLFMRVAGKWDEIIRGALCSFLVLLQIETLIGWSASADLTFTVDDLYSMFLPCVFSPSFPVCSPLSLLSSLHQLRQSGAGMHQLWAVLQCQGTVNRDGLNVLPVGRQQRGHTGLDLSGSESGRTADCLCAIIQRARRGLPVHRWLGNAVGMGFSQAKDVWRPDIQRRARLEVSWERFEMRHCMLSTHFLSLCGSFPQVPSFFIPLSLHHSKGSSVQLWGRFLMGSYWCVGSRYHSSVSTTYEWFFRKPQIASLWKFIGIYWT